MTIKFPTTGTRVSQGVIFKDLPAPRPKTATDKDNVPPRPLEDARPATHAQEHGWSN
jgi:hypothetical protein